MKISIILAAFIAYVAASDVNWTQIAGRLTALEKLVSEGYHRVRSLAVADNRQVGGVIGSVMEAAEMKAKIYLERIAVAIEARALTDEQAKETLTEIKGFIPQLRGKLNEAISKLSPAAQTEINAILDAGTETIMKEAYEVYGLIHQ